MTTITSQQLAAFSQLQQRLGGRPAPWSHVSAAKTADETTQGYSASIGPRGLTLEMAAREHAARSSEADRKSARQLTMPLTSISRSATRQTLADGALSDGAKRSEVQREPVTEWFQQTEQGLEHGYTLHKRPEGSDYEPVRLEIHPGGDWRALPAGKRSPSPWRLPMG